MVEAPTADADQEFYPDELKGRDWWVCWILDGEGRKRPVAPWQTGSAYPVKWRNTLEDDDRPEADFETARRWAGLRTSEVSTPDDVQSDELGLGLILPTDRPAPDERIVLIDWDDVRDPETGALHPVAAAYLKTGTTYAELSQSGTGIHQFVVGELPDRGKLIAEIDDEPLVGDDRPQVEIYDGGRHVAMTGQHVAGTPEDVAANQALVDDLVAEFADDPDRDGPGVAFGDYDLEPTEDRPACYHAVLQAREDPPDHLANWELIGYATMLGAAVGYQNTDILEDLRAHPAPPYGYDPTREPNEVARLAPQVRSGDRHPPSARTLARVGVLPDAEACDCPVHNSGRETAAGPQHDVETCEPPLDAPQAFQASDRWQQLQGERYDAVVDADGPVIWKDPAGAGKTTNALIAALDRDRPVAALFDKHEKAREVVRDDALGDGWDPFHLRGAGQKRHAPCMDADHAGEACPEHGASDACPSMCPVYDLADDSDLWRRYAALREAVGDVPAHFILGDDLPGHDEDGSCRWLEQFDALEGADHVVGVHEYQQLKTVREDRDVIVDETPRSLRDTSRVTVEGLVRTANALEDLADRQPRDEPVGYTAQDVARFVRKLADAVGGGDTRLDELEPPEPTWNAYETYDSAAGNYVETEPPEEDWQTGEALAQLKHAFNRQLINRISRGDWGGTPFCIDAVLAAAVEAGAPGRPLRQAIALSAILDACPRCGSSLENDNGAHCCGNCGWDERKDALIQLQGPEARARATLETDTDDTVVALAYESLPLERDLPTDPLVLDATATPSKVAHLYGVDRDTLAVDGDDDLTANMRVTQVLDGQYHASTIEDSDAASERIQRSIDTAGRVHDRPLYLVKKGLKPLFEFPDNSDVLHYHAARGLNREECDAVMCIGAPHPNVDDLQREAELLAMGRADARVGGAEHSTRRDAPNPPVYRKLRYTDDQGRGRAVPTKHYSGLVGDLFRETRENELEQAVHRARPILLNEADDPVDVYLLTNVPTDLPVDEVCSFAELADPLRAMLPVPDGALELLDVVGDVAAGDGPDGFRPDALVDARDGTIEEQVATYHRLARLSGRDELQVTERTVRNWITALEDLGLLAATAYEQREGRRYTAELATLKSALSSLSGNGGFEVAAVRRFRALAEAADGSLGWLRWAREAFGLPATGSIGGDPPPDDPA